MINKLTKIFAASQEAPVKTSEPQSEPPTSEAQPETETAVVQDEAQQPLAAENISLIKLCDAKLAKLSKFFSGGDEPPSVVEETPTEETPSASVIVPAPVQESSVAENISLLQLCDAKLSKLTKFFTGSEEAPAVTQETQTEERADGSNAATATITPTPQESLVPDSASSLNIEEAISDRTSESFLSSANDSPADNSVKTVEPKAEPIDSPLPINVEAPTGLQPSSAAEIPEMQQPFPFDEALLSTASAEAISELNRNQDSAIATQLLNLERRLEQHIEDAINAENERVAFREELRQQLNAAAQSHVQPLLEHKNMLETTLKGAFKKIVDRQATLENKYNQQLDMIQQVIGANQESISETAEKLNKLSEQARLLNENIRQLTQNIEAFQTKVDIDTVNARLTALENPPQKKRKSWFKK